jgi:hypothetical protein
MLTRRYPYCGSALIVTYNQMCLWYMPSNAWRWRGRCTHCNCDLEASSVWEIVTALVSLLLAVLLCWYIAGMNHDVSRAGYWATIIASLIPYYFLSGVIRYSTFRFSKLA